MLQTKPEPSSAPSAGIYTAADGAPRAQRRADYRTAAAAGSGLSIRMWRMAIGVYIGDRPLASQELSVGPRNIGAGGIGVTFFPKNGQPSGLNWDERLRIKLDFGDTSVLVEGRLIYPQAIDAADPTLAGIAFKRTDHSFEGRRITAAINKIVGALQRHEVHAMKAEPVEQKELTIEGLSH